MNKHRDWYLKYVEKSCIPFLRKSLNDYLSSGNEKYILHILTDLDDIVDVVLDIDEQNLFKLIALSSKLWIKNKLSINGWCVYWRYDEFLLGLEKIAKKHSSFDEIIKSAVIELEKHFSNSGYCAAYHITSGVKVNSGWMKNSNICEVLLDKIEDENNNFAKKIIDCHKTRISNLHVSKSQKLRYYILPKSSVFAGSFFLGRFADKVPRITSILNNQVPDGLRFFKDYSNTIHFLISAGEMKLAKKLWLDSKILFPDYENNFGSKNKDCANVLFSTLDILRRFQNHNLDGFSLETNLRSLDILVSKIRISGLVPRTDVKKIYHLDEQVDIFVSLILLKTVSNIDFSLDLSEYFNLICEKFIIKDRLVTVIDRNGNILEDFDVKYSLLANKMFIANELFLNKDYIKLSSLSEIGFFDDR